MGGVQREWWNLFYPLKHFFGVARSMSETSPQTPENHDASLASKAYEDFELPIAGFKGTPEEIEQQWYEQVYLGRGDVLPQFTWRAVVMGCLLGGILSLTNLYIGLKSGWGFGVAITACILSYTIWSGFYRFGWAKTPMTILENNCMQSASSSSGYSTGGTLISAFAAFIIINHHSLPMWQLFLWVFFLAILGVTMAIPMKRQMINIEQLRFPSGIAAAETLRALHSHGEKGARAAKALGISGLIAAILKFWEEGFDLLGDKISSVSLSNLMNHVNEFIFGQAWMKRTVMFSTDALFLAAGAMSGMKVSLSMFIGGTLCWAVFVPVMQSYGYVPIAGSVSNAYPDIVKWTLWGGVGCMVTSGLLSFFMQWRSIVKAFGAVGKMFSSGADRKKTPVDEIEAPMSWFFTGQIVSLVALSILTRYTFDMPWWQSAVAVVFSFFLALVACRVTGETDTTPIGAMGKVTQLLFGTLSPGMTNINLMAANITASSAASSAALLIDLKSGYLLGANPRKQFLAQFAGIFVGTLVTVTCFSILVPDDTVIGNKFPAPAARTWAAVAIAISNGISSLEPLKQWSLGIGCLVGIILPLWAKLFPKHDKWIPSAAGLGLSWTFHWYFSFLFLMGAIIGYAYEKKAPKQAEEFTFPVASGLIAGNSLMGVFIAFWIYFSQVLFGK
jgi:OPT family oligopeptide transporter